MHFTALPIILLAISASALPVPSRSGHQARHIGDLDIHPQAQVEPTPSAAIGSLPTASPLTVPAAEGVLAGPSGSAYRPAGKMTNAQRMALGLGPNAPTRRSTAAHKRASQVPMTPSQNTDNVVIRVITSEGEDLGVISDNGDDSLTSFGPNETPSRFTMPENTDGPFELGPSDQDDGLFGKVRKLLGAIPHRPDMAGSQMGPGSPNFANIGQGSCDPSGLLGLNLPPLPLVDSLGGVFSGLPNLLAAKLPTSPVDGLMGGSGGLGGLLNVAGPLNLLGGGGDSNDGGDASSPSSSSSGDSTPNTSSGGGLLGLQGLGLPGPLSSLAKDATSSDSDNSDDGNAFNGAPKRLAARPSRLAPQSAQESGEPMMQSAQSAIWNCDDQGKMGAVWQNPSGERVPAKFFTGGPCAHTICIAADIDLLKNIHGGEVKEINLIAGLL